MWFVVFGLGAAFLHRLRLPGAVSTLPYPPPAEALYALYFLLAALLRLAIRDARLAAVERRARRAGRRGRGFSVPAPGLLEMGVGVGKGIAEAVMGDFTGAALAGGALLLRVATARPDDPDLAARRVAQRRRAMAREQLRAALCVVGVGAVCVGAVWLPLLQPRLAVLLQACTRTWLR